MKLTHATILECTWKNKCFPFLVMSLVIPMICCVMTVFMLFGRILALFLFAVFFALFLHGYRDYLKVKRKKYVIYRQKCTSVYEIDEEVDASTVTTYYSVFGEIGKYKHKPTDVHVPLIVPDDIYSTEDEYRYTPL